MNLDVQGVQSKVYDVWYDGGGYSPRFMMFGIAGGVGSP